MQEGYKLQEVDELTSDDLDHLISIYKEKEKTIDQAFPWLF
jgi:hypothetical protein